MSHHTVVMAMGWLRWRWRCSCGQCGPTTFFDKASEGRAAHDLRVANGEFAQDRLSARPAPPKILVSTR